jgi:DNA-binding beta-propeller fold protein YncE
MKVRHRHIRGSIALAGVLFAIHPLATQAQEMCGGTIYSLPYTDVSGVGAAFCPGIMEAYVTGVSKGTTPTTFSPNETVTRVQMTTFLQRSLDQALTRSNWRAAAEQWWTPVSDTTQYVYVAAAPALCKPDRDSIWVVAGSTVVRVDASTGTVLGTWTGASNAQGVLVAGGHVFVTGFTSPGVIYVIDPTLPPGPVTTLSTTGAVMGSFSRGIAFDGANIWTANADGSISIIELVIGGTSTVSTISGGFTHPFGMVYDGSNMWTTDLGANKLLKLDGSGNIVQTVSTGAGPAFPVFDGANIWVPNSGDSTVSVVQASTGAIVASIASDGSNRLSQPATAAFDGARILVTNQFGESVTLFKAVDLSLIGAILALGPTPYGACSDGLNFWVTFNGFDFIGRI